MKKIILLLLCLAALAVSAAENIFIYLAPDAILPEKTAAEELKKGLQKIFGINAQLLQQSPEKCTFWVGQSKEAGKALKIADFPGLKTDEIILKKVNGKMILLGARPRGTVYAVYEFLEQGYGVRFWTPTVEYWPRHKKFFLPDIDHRFAPVIQRRIVYYNLRGSFPVKLRSNKYGAGAKWGGREKVIGFVHTFGLFVPAKKHFKDHPEWFALRHGKRVRNCQPCLTNKGFRQELIRAALEALRKNKNPRVISISQNDGDMTFCQCKVCKSFIKKHGNLSDLLMDTVNEVADAVAKEYPQIQVETLAYGPTIDPPKTIIPRQNVLIRFCPFRTDNSQSIAHPVNVKENTPFKVWRKYGNPLAAWTYETDFKRFYLPFPNWKALTQDLRFYADHGVIDVFQQGSYAGPIADLTDLRIWLLGKLQWNPYQNVRSLMEEFAKGYYGKAAPYILSYIDHMTATARKGNNMIPFVFSGPQILKAREILLAGEKAVKDDPVLRFRLQTAAVPVNLALLHLPEVWENPPAQLKNIKWQTLLDEQIKLIKAHKITRLAESTFTPDMLKRYITWQLTTEKSPVPVPGYPAGTSWKQIGAADCLRFKPYKFANDPEAFNSKAIEVTCNHTTWTSQLQRPPAGTWDIYVDLKCIGKNPTGKVASFGCYDVEKKKNILTGSVKAEALAGSGYHPVKIGRLTTSDDQFIYCAPANNKTADKLRISRYIFVEVKK